MPGTMSKADLVADLKATLHDAADAFENGADDSAFERFLANALPDLGYKRPLTRLGQVSLSEGEASYALTAYPDFYSYKSHQWGSGRTLPKPWEPGYPGALPRVYAVSEAADWALVFDPAPTALHIAALGGVFKFWYMAAHAIDADANNTTVNPQDRGLLLLRAQAEAMRELAIHQANKPVRLNDGLSGMPRNSTPAALHQALMLAFRETR